MLEFVFSFIGVPVLLGIFLFILYSALTWIPDFMAEAKEIFRDDSREEGSERD